MEEKFHGLPPLKRFRLMQQQEQEQEPKNTLNQVSSYSLPAKKRKEARDPDPPLPTPLPASSSVATICLPAKKRIWALHPHLDNPVFPIDLNVEYKPQLEEKESNPNPKQSDKKDEPQIKAEANEGAENDDDGIICVVCESTDGDPSDPIVFCDGCDLMVHSTCYGSPLIEGIPEGDWFCTQCLSKSSEPFSCCLCPNSGGAMKPTNNGKWAHILCALLVPEVFFSDSEGREGIDCSRVPKRRFEKSCYVCEASNGCAIDCSEPNCVLAFHVSCGLNEDLCIEYREGGKKGGVVAAFCKEHTELWQKQQQTGKFKIVARDEDKK